ncbi:MAG: homoprotocatechuate degradation operon regulator HpaR, partial [Burkholderiales bacterium]|nr:homoprotocatechuate degradation operon regulator HpaR [Burkholderiales bacterium]
MSTRSTTPSTFRHRNLPLLLLQAREAVIARFRPLLNAQGVTEQQWRIVRSLLDTGPQEPRQIGRLCGISSPSLAGVLARMEDLDLVSRERLAHDQRRVRVSLTARSRRLAAALAPRIDAEYAALQARVGPELLARAYATLDELMRLLGAASDAASDAAPDAA